MEPRKKKSAQSSQDGQKIKMSGVFGTWGGRVEYQTCLTRETLTDNVLYYSTMPGTIANIV